METLNFFLFSDDGEPTALHVGDHLVVNKKDRTIAFTRPATGFNTQQRLLGCGGDDKCIAYGHDMLTMLSHFGIAASRVFESEDKDIYELFAARCTGKRKACA